MRPHSLGYLFKEGIKSLWKNRTMSIASIGVLISCLLLTGIAGVISINISSMMKEVEGGNSITVYLEDTLPTLTGISVGEEIRKIDNVADCTYVSKDDALRDVMNSMDDNGYLFNGLSGDENFLPDAYTITMKDLSRYDETIAAINAIEGVESWTDYSDVATKLSNLDRLVRYCSIGIIIVLGIVSLFIISNTIKVTMFSRRMEINIMKSVGATNLFVRIPFIVEGIIIGVVSGLISATVLYYAYIQLEKVVTDIVPFLKTVSIDPYVWMLFVGYSIAGMLFGLLGGGISIGKYLKKEGENAVV